MVFNFKCFLGLSCQPTLLYVDADSDSWVRTETGKQIPGLFTFFPSFIFRQFLLHVFE